MFGKRRKPTPIPKPTHPRPSEAAAHNRDCAQCKSARTTHDMCPEGQFLARSAKR